MYTRSFTRLLSVGVVFILFLTACGGTSDPTGELPTLFILPTEADTGESVNAPTLPADTVAQAPTESPTASPTAETQTTGTSETPAPPTPTPSQTITDTPTRTPTFTATAPFVPGLLDELLEIAAVQTVLPQAFQPVGTLPGGIIPIVTQPADGSLICPEPPAGGFAAVFFADPLAASQLGCPAAQTLSVAQPAALQNFQRGQMIWVQGVPNYIYVVYSNGNYQRFIDTWTDGEFGTVIEPPPPGLFEPLRGFGKVWRNNPAVRDGLGWATNPEVGASASRQDFQRGTMLGVPARADILIMAYTTTPDSGTWRSVAGGY